MSFSPSQLDSVLIGADGEERMARYTVQEQSSRLVVGSDALEEGQSVADAVGGRRSKLGWAK